MNNQAILLFFAKYIESQLGIVYAEANYFQLEHRLKDIATQLGHKDLNSLYQSASISIEGSMKSLLLDLATNNETSFYRDPNIFKAFTNFMVPETIKTAKNKINLWSAASSAGQETYSLVMELNNYKTANPTAPTWSFLVSDVSDTILKRAQAGIYSQLEVQRGLPSRQLIQYFDKENETSWKVKPLLKQGLDFRKINLLNDWGPIGPFHIIFCRNVLIYQSVENKKKVIERLFQHLTPGGFLVLGAAESLFGLSNSFQQVTSDGAVFFKKPV